MDRPSALYDRLTSRTPLAGLPQRAVLPDYDGLSIARIPDLVAAALTLDAPRGALWDAVSPPHARRVLLIVLDGLGYRRFHEIAARDPDVRALATGGLCVPITSVFPSTTVAALATYSTGHAPAAHGMLGYRLFLREVSATVNMIQLAVVGGQVDTPLPDSFALAPLLPAPTVYERLVDQGIETHALLPRSISASGLSRVLYRGATQLHPGVGLSDLLVIARRLLNAARSPIVVTLYWPGLDSIAHPRGVQSEAYEAETASVAAAVRREILGQVKETLLLISSDHGFAAMQPADYVRSETVPALRDALHGFPVGEPRASYLFLRPERREDALAQVPKTVLDGLALVDARWAVEQGLFGPGSRHPETAARVGDLLAISTGATGLLHPYPDAPLLQGMHGGLTADEMIVPLIAQTL